MARRHRPVVLPDCPCQRRTRPKSGKENDLLVIDSWHPGALVLVITQRATHYESVTVRCAQLQAHASFIFKGVLLVEVVGC